MTMSAVSGPANGGPTFSSFLPPHPSNRTNGKTRITMGRRVAQEISEFSRGTWRATCDFGEISMQVIFDASVVENDDGPLSKGAPSKPLLGLPIARVIPQDVHSLMDYVDAALAGSGALLADDPRAKLASAILGAAGAGVALSTDYRLSAVKLIPIEAHEAIDHAWGLAAIALPFALGYWKTSPKVAAL